MDCADGMLKPNGEYELWLPLEVTVFGRPRQGQEPIFDLPVHSKIKVFSYVPGKRDTFVRIKILEAPGMDVQKTAGMFLVKKSEFFTATMTCGELIAVIVPEEEPAEKT